MERRATYYSRLIGVLIVIVFLGMRFSPVNKLQYYAGDGVFVHLFIKISLLILLFAFNSKVLKYTVIWNITLSCMLTALAYFISFFSFHVLMNTLETLDKQVTPLGWQFKYLWAENLIFAFLLIVITELVYVMVKNDRLLKPR